MKFERHHDEQLNSCPHLFEMFLIHSFFFFTLVDFYSLRFVSFHSSVSELLSELKLSLISVTVLFLTREATQLCDFVPGTNWHKWASQIVNFTLILRFGLSDNLAWPVVSVCSLMFATSKRLLQSFTFIFYYNSDLFKIFFSRHFNEMQSFTFISYYKSELFKIFP